MVYFENLFRSGDFLRAVAELARPVREALAFPALHQLGLVVPDVAQAAAVLETQGMGPFFIARGAPAYWQEKGLARQVAGKMGLAYHCGIEIELLEPLDGSSFYHRALDPSGRPVVQHIGFLVGDVDTWARKMCATGTGIWVRGQLKTGAVKTDFVYMDPNEEDGLIMEFISWTLFGRRLKPGPALAHTIGRLQKWTGRRCLAL